MLEGGVYWIHLVRPSVCPSIRPSVWRRHGFRSISQVCYWFSATSWLPGGHIGFFGFRTLTLLWLWISTPNFSSTMLMHIGRSLLIFSYVIFKMAAWWPYWIFSVSGLGRRHGCQRVSQVCFGISISNFICLLMVVIGRSLLIFSDVTLKMAAWQSYWISWFPNPYFSLALNINSKLQWHNTYVYG